MSSHHFVKEGQEPALLILDRVSYQVAGPLLEWAPLVVVSENVLEHIVPWGIKVDVVLADAKNIDELKKELLDQAPIKILSVAAGDSLLENALHFFTAARQQYVNILLTPVEKDFHEAERFAPGIQISFIDDDIRWSAITSGKFEKWVDVFTRLRVRRISDKQDILTAGLHLTNGHLESTEAGFVSLRSDLPFWVAERHS